MFIRIFLINFFFGVVTILVLRKIILRIKPLGLYLKKENQEIAKVGGMVLLFSILLFYRFFSPYFFITTILIFLLGFIDDLKELKVWQKFLGELIISLFFIFSSGITTEIIYLPKYVNFIITLIWMLGITNAFNLLDIYDGLAPGVSFMISFAFFYLANFTQNIIVRNISLLFFSSLSAILIFNFPPAKIYLGDSGSLLLGYIFSILAILISYAKTSHEMALFSPVFILGFPIFDTLFVSLRRIIQGKSIFKKSNDHFILCLINQGRKKLALFICYLLSLLSILLGISFTRLNNFLSLVLIILFLRILYRISSKAIRG